MTTSLRRVTTVLLVCSALLLMGCTKWGEKKNPNWREATSGEHLAKLFWNDVKDKNWQDLGAHVAPEFMGVNSIQSMDKPALLEHVTHLDLVSFQIGEVETRPAGKDLLVAYVITLRRKSANAPETPMRVLSVWQELNRGWVVVAMSAVPTTAN
jgi:hypothetical protein